MRRDAKPLHLFLRYLDPLLVVPGIEVALHGQPRRCARRRDVVLAGFVAVKGPALPVLAYLAEQPVFYRVPLRGAGGIVRNRNLDAVFVAEIRLKEVLPGVAGGAIAAPVVGENQQVSRLGVSPSSHATRHPCRAGKDKRARGFFRNPVDLA